MARRNRAPTGGRRRSEPAVKEVHVLWIPDGLSCDGDTVSVTAATQPSIEDIVMGAIPGLPRSTCTTACSPTRRAATSS